MYGRPGKISLQRTMPSVKKEFMAMVSICHMPQSDNKLMFFLHVQYSFSHLSRLQLSSQLGHQTQRPGSHHLHQVPLETHTHTLPLVWLVNPEISELTRLPQKQDQDEHRASCSHQKEEAHKARGSPWSLRFWDPDGPEWQIPLLQRQEILLD